MGDWHPFNEYYGPLPAVPAPNRKTWEKQLVWPRDKKQKGAHDWRRWKDIFARKGPDMWISKLGEGPDRPVWTGWKTLGHGIPRWDNLGYHFRQDNENLGLRWMERPHWEKYDFNARKYRSPQGDAWSDVKWDVKGRTPLYTRPIHLDQRGWVSPQMDGGAYNAHQGPHPFEYSENTPYWNWHHDRFIGFGN